MGNKNGPYLRETDIQDFSATSGLSENEIQEKFQQFIKDHPKGKIGRSEFRKMLCQAFGKTDECKASAKKLEPHVFRIYDTNDDGYIDFVEFMVVYHVLASGTNEEVLLKLFRLFDVNNDGTISRPEMVRLVKDLHGILAIAEGKSVETANAAFSEMDYDNDGSVSRTEFVKAVNEQKVSKMLTLNIIDIFIHQTTHQKS